MLEYLMWEYIRKEELPISIRNDKRVQLYCGLYKFTELILHKSIYFAPQEKRCLGKFAIMLKNNLITGEATLLLEDGTVWKVNLFNFSKGTKYDII